MTISFRISLILASALFGAAACEPDKPGGSTEEGAHGVTSDARSIVVRRITLPDGLREVSGLTSFEGRMLAIADELGQVYTIDFETRGVAEYFSFGQPPVSADFEGLAAQGDQIYALTSKGHLYHQSPTDTEFSRINTKLKKNCEFEGLAARPNSDELWLLCKTPDEKRDRDSLMIFVWDTHKQSLNDEATLRIPYLALGFNKPLNPSGLSFNASGDRVTIIAARQRAFLVMNLQGEQLARGLLPGGRADTQAEGIIDEHGVIYVADEGVNGPASLTQYPDGLL